jgi:hypothetical protein
LVKRRNGEEGRISVLVYWRFSILEDYFQRVGEEERGRFSEVEKRGREEN